MHSEFPMPAVPGATGVHRSEEHQVAELVGQVYEAAPPADRRRLLEYLLPPMGVLALVVVANGVFAKIRFNSGWPGLHIGLEDANRVQGGDVAALVDRLQQMSTDAVDGLVQVVSSSPTMAGSAAAALLLAALVRHARARRARHRSDGADDGTLSA